MQNGKLLWVDDEIDLLRAHIIFLENKGYSVDTATNGTDALEMCREKQYDLIMLDENMPGLSGLEVLMLIKEFLPATPVVMVTKSEEENIMDQAVGQKIADYLIKPVNPNQILLALKKNIHKHEIVEEITQSGYRQHTVHQRSGDILSGKGLCSQGNPLQCQKQCQQDAGTGNPDCFLVCHRFHFLSQIFMRLYWSYSCR